MDKITIKDVVIDIFDKVPKDEALEIIDICRQILVLKEEIAENE